MKSSLLALYRFVLTQGPQKLTGAPDYCLWKSDSLFLPHAWQSLQRGRPGAFSYIWFSMLACKKSVKSRYMLLSPGLRCNQHSSREKRGPHATRRYARDQELSARISTICGCVYVTRFMCSWKICKYFKCGAKWRGSFSSLRLNALSESLFLCGKLQRQKNKVSHTGYRPRCYPLIRGQGL